MIFENAYEAIENDFYQEMELNLNDILGSNVLEDEKFKLFDSLIDIFRKRCKETLINFQMKNDANSNIPNSSLLHVDKPFINLFFPYTVGYNAATIPTQYFGNIQNMATQQIIPSPYYFNFQNYQPPAFQQQQFYQPNTAYFSHPIPILNIANNAIKAKKKVKSKKKYKKTKKQKNSIKKHQENSEQNNSKSKILKFNHKEGDEFNGIFKYLTDKTGGNIHDNETIEVTSNSINPVGFSTNHPKNLLSDVGEHGYLSDSKIGEIWIIFDFKTMEIELSSYTFHITSTINQIKNWEVEISKDNCNWEQVDKHTNDSSLGDVVVIKTFNVKQNQFARFVRFSFNMAEAQFGNFAISIDSIEFYGQLKC